jgi:hypothetical protein
MLNPSKNQTAARHYDIYKFKDLVVRRLSPLPTTQILHEPLIRRMRLKNTVTKLLRMKVYSSGTGVKTALMVFLSQHGMLQGAVLLQPNTKQPKQGNLLKPARPTPTSISSSNTNNLVFRHDSIFFRIFAA